MADRSKIHHIVPRVLQKAFCFEENRIWFSERTRESRFSQPEARNTSSTFKIRNYYTVLDGDKPSDIVERVFYGRIDDFLGKVIPECLEALDGGNAPIFKGQSLAEMQDIVFELIKRTPEFVKSRADDTNLGRQIVQASLEKANEAVDGHTGRQELLAALNDKSQLTAIGRDVRVRGVVSRPNPRVQEELRKRSVRWVASTGRHSFVLPSVIACRIGNGGSNGLANPMSEIWLPISPKYAMVLVRDEANRIPLRVGESRDRIRRFNEYAARISSQLGSHDEKLISSLVRRS